MEIKKSVNLKGVCCPLNFVKAKLAIEELEQGDVIEIILDEGAPLMNVTRSLKDEGHTILKVIPEETGLHFKVFVKKG